eukprot:GEZU01029524.1.p1 GENE.GEZU01029524.1~~GEZU01029524.1.p1  ORF type:complete len:457 (+),score=119.88 GEZU01029524.1:38-1372(+)
MLPPSSVKIVGTGLTRVGKLGRAPTSLMMEALQNALGNANLTLRHLNGLIAIPSLASPHFMEAHYLATRAGLLPHKNVIVRTIDTGGAGPVTGLLEATRMIRMGWCDVVAVVAGDAVSSLSKEEFLRRADQTCSDPEHELPSPVIPHGYDRIAQWQMKTYGVTREQLAMCSVMMSMQAAKNPRAMTKKPYTLEEVLASPQVAPVTTVLECARRADGGAAIVLASQQFLERNGIEIPENQDISVIGGGEGSGPLFPPPIIDEDMFSCERATRSAYTEARLTVDDIDFFGLYDCFPICFLRAIEAVGLAKKGQGGTWIERKYHEMLAKQKQEQQEQAQAQAQQAAAAANGNNNNKSDATKKTTTATSTGPVLPVNTHGGLLAFGAPWEVPAMYNIIEAVAQLRGEVATRPGADPNQQVPNARRALVYGNGGIFSASAVAILGRNGK